MRRVSFFAIALGLMAFLWACDGGDVDNTVEFEITPSNSNPAVGETFTVTVKVTSDELKLSTVNVEAQVTDSTDKIVSLLDASESASDLSFSKEFEIVVPANTKPGAKITVIVESIDSKDTKESEQLNIVIASYMKIQWPDKVIGHLYGPLPGAFDIVQGLPVALSGDANEKDLIDMSENDKELAGQLRASAETGTKFVDLSKSYTIESINSGNVAKIWAERSSSDNVLVQDGTKFLAKLRGGNTYAVVHIKKVDYTWDEDNTGDDLGRYEFDVYMLQ